MMVKFIKYCIIIILIILPITDLLFKTSEVAGEGLNRYSFYLRVIALLLIVFYLIWYINDFISIFRNSVIVSMGFLFVYILVHFLFTYEVREEIVAISKISYLFIGFFFFYLLALSENISETDMRWLYALMSLIVFVTILQFIPLRATLRSVGLSGMADNKGYTLVSAFPILLLFYRKKTFPLFISLIIVGVLISGKRGAILCLLVSAMVIYAFVKSEEKQLTFRSLFYIFLTFISLGFMFAYFNEYISIAFERVFAIADDKGSGRDNLYLLYWSGFKNSGELQLLFGHGLFSGVRFLNTTALAHNDWLEMLYDYGLIGALLYLNVFIQLFRYLIFKLTRQNKIYFYILLGTVLVLLVRSFVSGTFLMTVETIWLYIPIAFVIGRIDNMMYKAQSYSI